MKNKEYIEKWLNNSLSDEELVVFKQSDDYKSLIRLDQELQRYKAPEFDVEASLISLNEQKSKEAKVVSFYRLETILRIAAAVVLVFLSYIFTSQESLTTVITQVAQKEEVSLPDQTIVQLNASSSLSFNASTWEEQRSVALSGEAYFKVSKGSRFDVNTNAGTVSVLGTQFNIKVREDYFEVECFEGHVVVIQEGDTIHLLEYDGLRIIEGVSSILRFNNSIPSWTMNESSFSSVPYSQVLYEFERQYDVKITTKNVDLKKQFSGSFTHADFEIALKSISLPLNLNIEQPEEKHIILSVD